MKKYTGSETHKFNNVGAMTRTPFAFIGSDCLKFQSSRVTEQEGLQYKTFGLKDLLPTTHSYGETPFQTCSRLAPHTDCHFCSAVGTVIKCPGLEGTSKII